MLLSIDRSKKSSRQLSELASSRDSIASSSKAKPSKSGASGKNNAVPPKEIIPRGEKQNTETERDASEDVSEDVIQPEAIPGLGIDEEVLAGYGQEDPIHVTTPERETTPFAKHVV